MYVLVDDWYKAEGASLVKRHKGGKLLMSDSEVLTLALISQWEAGVPWRSERGLVRYLHAHGRGWFPHMLQVSAFNRRVRYLCTALAALQRWVAGLLEQAEAGYEVMDGLPLPVCSLGQTLREKQHWLGQVSAKGHGGTHGGWFYGQRWWMCVSAYGAIRGWLLARADINERWVLDVVFGEDASRTRTQNADDNLTVLRKIALNLVRQHPAKGTLKGKRYRAALNEDFLLEVMQSSFNLMR